MSTNTKKMAKALHLAMLYIGDRSAGSSEAWVAAANAAGLDPEEATSTEVIHALERIAKESGK